MSLTWDPIYAMNLLLCVLILVLGIRTYTRGKRLMPLLVGIAFGPFWTLAFYQSVRFARFANQGLACNAYVRLLADRLYPV